MTRTAISTNGLTRRFGAVLAVDSLDLAVPVGEVVAFLGPNGAGKTTTIRMILGLLIPDAGEVRLFGEPLAADRRRLLRRVGALVEAPSLYDHLTGRQNLDLSRRLLGLSRARLDEVLDIIDLTDAAERSAGGYSLGMRQRLGLGLALLGKPDLLILDEPLNGLDPAGIREMRALIRRRAAEHGVTVFVSSHLLGEVEQMASRLSVVASGRLAFQGTLAELNAEQRSGIDVGVDRPAEAAEQLRQAGFTIELSDNRDLLRISATHDEAARRREAETICQRLIENGFAVHHLAVRRPSLETRFLDLVGSRTGSQPMGGER